MATSSWSFIAQRALTGEFLDWDVPLALDGLEWQLSGPGSLKATVAPDVGGLRASDGRLLLEEWSTLLYAEHGGIIRWAGILITSSFEDEVWNIEAAGFSTYPHAVDYAGDYSQIGVDPATVIRHIWEHVQSYANGDLDVQVVGATGTGVRLGTPARTEKDDEGKETQVDAEPYVLHWNESPNCGEEIDTLAKEGGLDWYEEHAWTADRERIAHRVVLAHPRAGRRRDDLVFAQGDNAISVVTVESNGDDFANEVVGLGAGEGRAMLCRTTPIQDGRLRRVHVLADKSVSSASRMDTLIAEELNLRKAAIRVESVDIIDHPNAPLGSWQLGDDVLIRAEVPWLGEIEVWCRVVGWTLTGENTASLSLVRSDLYRYGGNPS